MSTMPEVLCKICGLTRADDAALCHSLGVDLIGFIFVPASPRFVEPRRAALLPDGTALRAGVFAGTDLAGVREIARLARLDFIQLHGGEDPSFCRSLGPERVIKTLWPQTLAPDELEQEMERFASVCAYFLLDAGTSGGGSGRSLNLEGLRHIRSPRPWFLAGGLGTRNLPSTLAVFEPGAGPNGVDLNSALERAPGIKDHQLVREAITLVKGSGVSCRDALSGSILGGRS
jgi:phosphoribosylanthranilate isomerase